MIDFICGCGWLFIGVLMVKVVFLLLDVCVRGFITRLFGWWVCLLICWYWLVVRVGYWHGYLVGGIELVVILFC